jgi:hypothetical protein
MRKAANISPIELVNIYEKKREEVNEDQYGFNRYNLVDIDKIGDDLKVEVDFENAEIEPFVGLGDELLGVRRVYLKHVKGSGPQYLSCIGMRAGGDWQYPVNFFVYLDQDGKTLRCYVPKKGNTWNWDTKSAFGEDEEKDKDFLRKWAKKNQPETFKVMEEQDDESHDWAAEDFIECMENYHLMVNDMAERIDVVS